MMNLDYLKVGNCIKQSVTGRYSGDTKVNIIEIRELKINKKTAWVNGYKYEISGNKLYNDGGVIVTILTEVDEQFASEVKDNLNQELVQLEKSLEYIYSLVKMAKNANTLSKIDEICSKIKATNNKIALNFSN
jgi:hypothetical protein